MSVPYTPDSRLTEAYDEATRLNAKGLEGLCPFYTELAGEEERYQNHVFLGKGAVKEVYRAFDSYTHRRVALARLRTDRGPEFYDPFIREAWLTASLSHPNIIMVHDAGIGQDGCPFFTMDLKGSSNLSDRVAAADLTGRRELLEVFMKVCDAVAYAHSKGVAHLDLKPDNIQTDAFGEVLVCDWGLAKTFGEIADEDCGGVSPETCSDDSMTLLGQVKGSLGYMAPEQAEPGCKKDHRSDMFALGCILHFILTGDPPFKGTEEEILTATRQARPGSLRRRYPECNIPAALEAVALKAMARDPEKRYESASVLRNEISSFIAGYSTLAEQPGFFRELRLFVSRNALPVAMAVAGIVAFSVIGVISVQKIRNHREKAAQFQSKAQIAETLYHDELDRSAQQRMELSSELADSARDLKRIGVCLRPLETVREASQLVASAIALNNNSSRANVQRFYLHCITLNFKEALMHPLEEGDKLDDFRVFTDAFPHFDFTEEHRPDIETLEHFLRQAAVLNSRRSGLMECMVAYDAAARQSHAGYAPVVEALIDYRNTGRGGDVTLEYDSEASSLVLRAEGDIRILSKYQWSLNGCLLRFLPLRSLKIEAGKFFVSDLHRLSIETLDLRACDRLVFKNKIDLPLLHRVLIRRGQIDPSELREQMNVHGPFEIVESI